jgi:hypothetical protein
VNVAPVKRMEIASRSDCSLSTVQVVRKQREGAMRFRGKEGPLSCVSVLLTIVLEI